MQDLHGAISREKKTNLVDLRGERKGEDKTKKRNRLSRKLECITELKESLLYSSHHFSDFRKESKLCPLPSSSASFPPTSPPPTQPLSSKLMENRKKEHNPPPLVLRRPLLPPLSCSPSFLLFLRSRLPPPPHSQEGEGSLVTCGAIPRRTATYLLVRVLTIQYKSGGYFLFLLLFPSFLSLLSLSLHQVIQLIQYI